MSLVMTKAALALKNAESNFQVVKFESYKAKKKDGTETVEKSVLNKPKSSQKDLDLKKIRHEIVRFGMSGFDATKKEEAKIALAVSLGAKPPKREYVNYKELMAKRKDEKQKRQDEKQLMISKSILQSGGKKKKKGLGNDVGHLLTGYGKSGGKKKKKGLGNDVGHLLTGYGKSGGKKIKKGLGNDVGHLLTGYGKVHKKDLKDNKGGNKGPIKKKKKII